MRTVAESRALLLTKAKWITSQHHFDQIMETFPPELWEEIFAEVHPLLKNPALTLPKLSDAGGDFRQGPGTAQEPEIDAAEPTKP